MKPNRFTYHRPTSLGDAITALAGLPNAKVLAGGQSLMPMLNLRIADPGHLIDLGGIDGLAYIRAEGQEVRIGALTTQRTIEFSEIVRERLPLIAQAILELGHRQTRNRGTIGGSLCHLDPSAELPLMASVFGATIVVAGPAGLREIPVAEFTEDMLTPAIDADEIVTEIRFLPWPDGHGWGFAEYARRKGDFAIVSAAAMLLLDGQGRIARSALALGGVASVPFRVESAEAELIGELPSEELFGRVAEVCAEVDPLDDPFVPGWYRQKLSVTYARRVLNEAWARCENAKGPRHV